MERTGHQSTTAVRCYKRTASVLQQEVSNLLQPPAPTKVARNDVDARNDVVDIEDVQGESKQDAKCCELKQNNSQKVKSKDSPQSPVVINISKGDRNVTITL